MRSRRPVIPTVTAARRGDWRRSSTLQMFRAEASPTRQIEVRVNAKARESRDPWRIHFFQRHVDDDPCEAIPALAFLDGLSLKVAAEVDAVLDAVAKAPPPSFSGGGKWEAMPDDMAGFYEVRVQGGGQNHRLFGLLEREAEDLGGPSIVCVGGLSKPPRTAARPRDYGTVKQFGSEFARRRAVLRSCVPEKSEVPGGTRDREPRREPPRCSTSDSASPRRTAFGSPRA